MKSLKQLSLLLVTLSLLTVTCTKQSNAYPNSKQLTGTWQWVRSSGGIFYHVETPASTGVNIDLKLTSDNKFYFYSNDSLTSEGTFILKTPDSTVVYTDKPAIHFSSGIEQLIDSINTNNLQLSDYCCDGFVNVYIRK